MKTMILAALLLAAIPAAASWPAGASLAVSTLDANLLASAETGTALYAAGGSSMTVDARLPAPTSFAVAGGTLTYTAPASSRICVQVAVGCALPAAGASVYFRQDGNGIWDPVVASYDGQDTFCADLPDAPPATHQYGFTLVYPICASTVQHFVFWVGPK